MTSPIARAVLSCVSSPAVPDGAGGGEMAFTFPAGFAGFEGHFPGAPILPGVLQVHCALAAAEALGAAGELAGVRNAKFLSPVGPGETLRVRVAPDPRGEAGFSVRASVGERLVGSFTVLVRPPEGGVA